MSSNTFGVFLPADSLGRRIVRLGGIVLTLTGMGVILCLPIGWHWRTGLMLIWLGDCTWSLLRFERGCARIMGLRLDSTGVVTVAGPDDSSMPTRLVSGSVVCRRVAWLRFRLPDGSQHAELLIAARIRTLDWHRLQLIWRLCKQTFGHPGRA